MAPWNGSGKERSQSECGGNNDESACVYCGCCAEVMVRVVFVCMRAVAGAGGRGARLRAQLHGYGTSTGILQVTGPAYSLTSRLG